MCWKQLNFRRSAQGSAPVCNHNWPIEENGKTSDEAEQFIIRPLQIAKPEFGEGRVLFADKIAQGPASRLDDVTDFAGRWRGLEIVDHNRLNARRADHRQCVARRAAGGIVVDGGFHLMVGLNMATPCGPTTIRARPRSK